MITKFKLAMCLYISEMLKVMSAMINAESMLVRGSNRPALYLEMCDHQV